MKVQPPGPVRRTRQWPKTKSKKRESFSKTSRSLKKERPGAFCSPGPLHKSLSYDYLPVSELQDYHHEYHDNKQRYHDAEAVSARIEARELRGERMDLFIGEVLYLALYFVLSEACLLEPVRDELALQYPLDPCDVSFPRVLRGGRDYSVRIDDDRHALRGNCPDDQHREREDCGYLPEVPALYDFHYALPLLLICRLL